MVTLLCTDECMVWCTLFVRGGVTQIFLEVIMNADCQLHIILFLQDVGINFEDPLIQQDGAELHTADVMLGVLGNHFHN